MKGPHRDGAFHTVYIKMPTNQAYDLNIMTLRRVLFLFEHFLGISRLLTLLHLKTAYLPAYSDQEFNQITCNPVRSPSGTSQ